MTTAGIARTNATGSEGMLPSLIAWSTSLGHDRAMAAEDLLGSAAHVTMLARTGLVESEDAAAIRAALLSMFAEARSNTLVVPDGEEDIHMAVEAELGRRLGAVAGRLHTARSRNDQVALDLRLYVRGQTAQLLLRTSALVDQLCARATSEMHTLLPAYTHRQRAQPVSVAFLLCAWASQLVRAGEVLAFALSGCDRSPLGSGACSGSSLPIDRNLTAELLGFSKTTINALDTVGDRDFALDYTWAGARLLLALSRLSTDIIDYSTSEFGLVRLDGRIAAGSSMMPQKKNPDVFELVRGESGKAVGNVMALLMMVKGLPTGYNRDLQEDRRPLLETGPLALGALDAVITALPYVHFDGVKGEAGLAEGFTQATDLAEALVRTGIPFREAYKAAGSLVHAAIAAGLPLSKVGVEMAKAAHPMLPTVLDALDAKRAMAAKESIGGTGPRSVTRQIEQLRREAERLVGVANAVPTLDTLAQKLGQVDLRATGASKEGGR